MKQNLDLFVLTYRCDTNNITEADKTWSTLSNFRELAKINGEGLGKKGCKFVVK